MTAASHVIAAVPLAVGVHLFSNSWEATALAVSAGVFIDVDHLADYLYFRRGWKGLEDFFETFREARMKKAFILFHAWEYPILYSLLYISGIGPGWLWPLFLGSTYHLVFDTIANPVKPSFYWLFRRALSGFEFSGFYRPDRWQGVGEAWDIISRAEPWGS